MPKINIKNIIKNETDVIKQEYNAIKTDNTIKYIDDNGSVSINVNKEKIELNRDNLKLIFDEKKATDGILTSSNKQFKLRIYTNKIVVEDKYIEIDYLIEEQKINFKLFIK